VIADYWRQEELVRPSQLDTPITVVGAGGIGSPTVLALAKMGCRRITVFDPDTVEPHNLPNQLYRPTDVGCPKVEALAAIVQDLTGTRIDAVPRLADDDAFTDILVSAVDTMATRVQLWEGTLQRRPTTRLFIDARMGGEVGRLYVVDPTDPDRIAAYRASLHSDDESDPDPCSQQSVIYSVFVMAGLICAAVKGFAIGELQPVEVLLDLRTLTLLTSTGWDPHG
jgi:molybdopterin/thiamine biosynthesis adenylyltransferase